MNTKSLTQSQENIIAEWKQKFDIQDYEVKIEGSKILIIGKDNAGNNKRFELKNEAFPEPRLKEEKELARLKKELDWADEEDKADIRAEIEELKSTMKKNEAFPEPKLKEEKYELGNSLYGSKLNDKSDIQKQIANIKMRIEEAQRAEDNKRKVILERELRNLEDRLKNA